MYSTNYLTTDELNNMSVLFDKLFAFLGFIWIIGLVISIFKIICMWKCYKKMGEAGWVSLIPFYCNWVLCEHTLGKGWLMFLWLVPVVGQFMMFFTYWKLFRGFDKSTLFCVLGLIFQPIALAICAFDKSVFVNQSIM